jgi:hypothetical protein
MTSNLLATPPSPPLLRRDLLQDIEDGASSLLAVAATKVSDTAGHIETALGSAVEALPESLQIENYTPENCTFGIHSFCVGYKNAPNLACSNSPFDISALLPEKIQDLPAPFEEAVRKIIADLSPLADGVSKLPMSILSCSIAGNVLIMLMVLVTEYLTQDSQKVGDNRRFGLMARMLTNVIMTTICCAPYLAMVLLQARVFEDIKGLPDWVEAERGEVFGLSIGLTIFTAAVAALLALQPCYSVQLGSRLERVLTVRKEASSTVK